MHNGAIRANRLRAPASVRTTVFYGATLDSRFASALAHRRLAVLAGCLSVVLARLLYATLARGRPCCAWPRRPSAAPTPLPPLGGLVATPHAAPSTQRSGSGGGQRQQQQRSRETPSPQQLREWYAGRQRSGGTGPCTYVLCTGDRAGEQCGGLHSTQRCFGRLTDAWRHQFPDATEIPRWGDLSRAGVAIFDLDYDAILAAMYAVSTSDEGDCYLYLPADPGGEAAALGACEAAALGVGASAAPGAGESALSGTASAQVFHTFTLDSGASRSFFRDRTTLTPLSRPVAVSLADPSGRFAIYYSLNPSLIVSCLDSAILARSLNCTRNSVQEKQEATKSP
ncbi:unnamed protein product [Closterium sp. NIES-53]